MQQSEYALLWLQLQATSIFCNATNDSTTVTAKIVMSNLPGSHNPKNLKHEASSYLLLVGDKEGYSESRNLSPK